jgi:hypothetical protein
MLRRLHVLSLIFLPSVLVALPQTALPVPGTPKTLTATVRAVDAQERTVEVVTGVGLALRVVKFSWNEATQVKVAGATAATSALKPGQVVRVEYTRSESGNLAKTIETVAATDGGGQ